MENNLKEITKNLGELFKFEENFLIGGKTNRIHQK